MRLDHIASLAVDQLLGRLIRRALLAVAMAIFALVALYHFAVAGTLALAAQFGVLEAQLIMGAIFCALGVVAWIILWAMRGPRAASSTPILSNNPREMQIAMLVEAVMLGYALARKGERAR